MAKPTLQAVITQVLRASGVPDVLWAPTANDVGVGNPYYGEAPEPPPDLPSVVFDIPDSSTIENFFEGGYTEEYKVNVEVRGTREHVATVLTPYATTSVLYFLDALMNTKDDLAGDNFKVSTWFRDGWSLTSEDNRAPTGNPPPFDPTVAGGRVWVARASYTCVVLYNGLG